MINLLLIGTGAQGSRYHNTILTGNRAKLCATANSTRDYKDLIDLHKPQGVIAAAHPSITPAVIKYCNFLNIPCLVEKPVSLSLKELNELDRVKIPVLVNYSYLYNPLFRKLLTDVKDQSSPITKIVSLGYNSGPKRDFSTMYDYMPHDLSMALSLTPAPYTIVSKKAKTTETGTLCNVKFLTQEGVELGILCGNGGREKKRQFLVFLENGSQFLFDDSLTPDKKEPMRNILNDFLDTIEGKKEKPSLELTFEIQKILFRLGKTDEA